MKKKKKNGKLKNEIDTTVAVSLLLLTHPERTIWAG